MNLNVKLKSPGTLRAGIRTLAKLRETTIRAEIKRNAGIIAEYAAKMTPPTTGSGQNTGAIKQSWQAQQRAGKKAITRDVGKVFQPLRSLGLLKNVQWAAAVSKMIRRRDVEGLQDFLASKGVHNQVIEEASVELHNKHRPRRGRAKKAGGPYLVIQAASIKQVLENQLAHEGQAKAGWIPGMLAGGRAVAPAWVSRHNPPGTVRDRTSHPLRPSMRVENNVLYGASFSPLQIAQKAVEIRDRTAAREIKETLRAKLKQAMRTTGLGK